MSRASADGQAHADHEQRHGEAEAGADAAAQAVADRGVVGVAAAEVEAQHAAQVFGEHRVERLLRVPEARLVVAVRHLPLLQGFGQRLLADGLAGDVVRRGDEEEEHEQEQQDADDGDGAEQHAADEVGDHRRPSRQARRSPGATNAAAAASST